MPRRRSMVSVLSPSLNCQLLAVSGVGLVPVTVPVDEAVVSAEAHAGRPVARPGEPAADGAAVPADLVHRLDDQRVLADALLDRRQLAGLHQLRQLRGLLEALRELGGIRDGGRALELADELRADLWRGCWRVRLMAARPGPVARKGRYLPLRRCGRNLAGQPSIHESLLRTFRELPRGEPPTLLSAQG